jgi:hypothetical protein
MDRLDRDEAEAQRTEARDLSSGEIADLLRDLQSLFAHAEPGTRHRIMAALFEQVEVLAPSEVWPYPSVEAEARWRAAAMAGEFRVESTNGRGERISTFMSDGDTVVRFLGQGERLSGERTGLNE